MKFGGKRGEVIRMDTYNMIDFNEKKGFICDMDGVIYHGNRVLPGVAEFIRWLHDENKEYLFLTNNSGYTPRELSQKLARMGLDVTEEHFIRARSRRRRSCAIRRPAARSLPSARQAF